MGLRSGPLVYHKSLPVLWLHGVCNQICRLSHHVEADKSRDLVGYCLGRVVERNARVPPVPCRSHQRVPRNHRRERDTHTHANITHNHAAAIQPRPLQRRVVQTTCRRSWGQSWPWTGRRANRAAGPGSARSTRPQTARAPAHPRTRAPAPQRQEASPARPHKQQKTRVG